MANEKYFLKTSSQQEFEYDLFTNLPRTIVACDFSLSSFKLKRGNLLPLTKQLSKLENLTKLKENWNCRSRETFLEYLPLFLGYKEVDEKSK